MITSQPLFLPKGNTWPVESGLTGLHSVGGTQKGDIVKELMKTCYDNGINMFDVGPAPSMPRRVPSLLTPLERRDLRQRPVRDRDGPSDQGARMGPS